MFIQMLGGLFHLFSQYKLKLIQFKIICHFHQMTENTNKNLLLQPENCSVLDNVCWYPRWPELFLKTAEKGGKTESIKLSKSYHHGLISPVGTRFNLPGRAPSGYCQCTTGNIWLEKHADTTLCLLSYRNSCLLTFFQKFVQDWGSLQKSLLS